MLDKFIIFLWIRVTEFWRFSLKIFNDVRFGLHLRKSINQSITWGNQSLKKSNHKNSHKFLCSEIELSTFYLQKKNHRRIVSVKVFIPPKKEKLIKWQSFFFGSKCVWQMQKVWNRVFPSNKNILNIIFLESINFFTNGQELLDCAQLSSKSWWCNAPAKLFNTFDITTPALPILFICLDPLYASRNFNCTYTTCTDLHTTTIKGVQTQFNTQSTIPSARQLKRACSSGDEQRRRHRAPGLFSICKWGCMYPTRYAICWNHTRIRFVGFLMRHTWISKISSSSRK